MPVAGSRPTLKVWRRTWLTMDPRTHHYLGHGLHGARSGIAVFRWWVCAVSPTHARHYQHQLWLAVDLAANTQQQSAVLKQALHSRSGRCFAVFICSCVQQSCWLHACRPKACFEVHMTCKRTAGLTRDLTSTGGACTCSVFRLPGVQCSPINQGMHLDTAHALHTNPVLPDTRLCVSPSPWPQSCRNNYMQWAALLT